MHAKRTLKFPSGRPVKRLKQDAKSLAKNRGIPLYQALDEIAEANGADVGWTQAIEAMRLRQPAAIQLTSPQSRSPLALKLGITNDDLDQLTWEAQANESADGLVYDYTLTFDETSPRGVLNRIDGLLEGNVTRVSPNVFDEASDWDGELDQSFVVYTDMNPYRKLLVLGLNELLERGLLSLDWDGKSNESTAFIKASIAGYDSIVLWSGVGFGEVRISVWWKYNHDLHPQTKREGSWQERFTTASPLAHRQKFSKFVGVVCSAWLERDKGKYLQGKGFNHLFEKYARRGELAQLKRLPNPIPLKFEVEGKFHM